MKLLEFLENNLSEEEIEEIVYNYLMDYYLEDLGWQYHSYENYINENISKKIGIELELENVDQSDLVWAGINNVVALEPLENNDYATIIASQDGSLSSEGIEFVTDADRPEAVLLWIEQLLQHIYAEDDEETGMHVHFDKSFWNNDIEEINKFIVVFSMWRRFIQHISDRESWSYNKWSETNCKTMAFAEEILNYDYLYDFDHATAINTEHPHTVEIRVFRATTSSELIKSRILLLINMIEFIQELSKSEIYSIIFSKTYSNDMLKRFLNQFITYHNQLEVLNGCFYYTYKRDFKNTCLIGYKQRIKHFKECIFRPE
jgi:uncharacterized protein YeeX (DUF496 family)